MGRRIEMKSIFFMIFLLPPIVSCAYLVGDKEMIPIKVIKRGGEKGMEETRLTFLKNFPSYDEVMEEFKLYNSIAIELERKEKEKGLTPVEEERLKRVILTKDFLVKLAGMLKEIERASDEERMKIGEDILRLYRSYIRDSGRMERGIASSQRVFEGVKIEEGEEVKVESIPLEMGQAEVSKVFEERIMQLFHRKEYGELIKYYDANSKRFPSSFKGRYAYIVALGESGMRKKAIDEGMNLLDEAEIEYPWIDELSLRLGIWLFKEGEIGRAKTILETLVKKGDILNRLKEEAGSILVEIEKGYPATEEGGVTAGRLLDAELLMKEEKFEEARRILEEAEKDAKGEEVALVREKKEALEIRLREYIKEKLETIHILGIEKGDFKTALLMLNNLMTRFPDSPFKGKFEEIREELRIKEKRSLEEKNRKLYLSLEGKMEKAKSLISQARYEEALTLLKELIGTPFEDEARRAKEEAVDNLVVRERERLAKEYVSASKIEDKEEKRKRISEIRDGLKKVLETYPETSYRERIEENIRSIEEEIERMEGGE